MGSQYESQQEKIAALMSALDEERRRRSKAEAALRQIDSLPWDSQASAQMRTWAHFALEAPHA